MMRLASCVLIGGLGLIHAMSTKELNAFWRAAERTVATGDFATYASLYHEDAVVVEGASTKLVKDALDGWKAGFDATAEGRQSTQLSFRFSHRYDDPASAHESGIFRYQKQTKPDDSVMVRYVFFESLLVKKGQRWIWLMEYQKGEATKDDWDALPEFEIGTTSNDD